MQVDAVLGEAAGSLRAAGIDVETHARTGDPAEAIIEVYAQATDVERTGAVMFGTEMIDEASRKMAEQVATRGRAAGMTRLAVTEDR